MLYALLFADAKPPENIPQNLLGIDLANDRSQMVQRFADVLGNQICWQTGCQAVLHAVQGYLGIHQGLVVADVAYKGATS